MMSVVGINSRFCSSVFEYTSSILSNASFSIVFMFVIGLYIKFCV